MSEAHLTATGVSVLDHEIIAEKAAALGRAGERAEISLKRPEYAAANRSGAGRSDRVKADGERPATICRPALCRLDNRNLHA